MGERAGGDRPAPRLRPLHADDVAAVMAVDKKLLVDRLLRGYGLPLDTLETPEYEAFDPSIKVEYNPDKAKQLLAEAGVKDLKITLGSPTGRYIQDIQFAQAISGYLRKVGIDANVRTMDWPSYVSAMLNKAGPFDIHVLGWAPGALDGPTQLQMFTAASIPPKGLNTSFFSTPAIDKLAAESGLNLDEASRNQQLCQIQKDVWQQAPWIFLWSQTLILAYNAKLTGVSYLPNEKFETMAVHPKP